MKIKTKYLLIVGGGALGLVLAAQSLHNSGSVTQDGAVNLCTESGGSAANAYVCTNSTPITALVAGVDYKFSTAHANTGASTLSVDGHSGTIKSVTTGGSLADLTGGQIGTGTPKPIYTVRWDGTYFELQGTGASGGGGSLLVRAPYLYDGTHYFIPQVGMFQATIPNLTGWALLAGQSPNPTWAANTGTNGNIQLVNTNASNTSWYAVSASTSIEAVFSVMSNAYSTAEQPALGVFLATSTNLYVAYGSSQYNSSAANGPQINIQTWAYNSSSGISGGVLDAIMSPSAAVHDLKMSISGSTLTVSAGMDSGGGLYQTCLTITGVGTITQAGLALSPQATAHLTSLSFQ